MTIELLQTLSLVTFIVAGLLFLLAIALFFLLDVPKLFGDITGSTARKAIESIRQQNESTGDKAYKPSHVNAARGKVTDKISQSGKLKPKVNAMGVAASTERFDTAELAPKAEETTILDGGETTVLDAGETTVLGTGTAETTVLNELKDSTRIPNDFLKPDKVNIDVEFGFTGSSELIE